VIEDLIVVVGGIWKPAATLIGAVCASTSLLLLRQLFSVFPQKPVLPPPQLRHSSTSHVVAMAVVASDTKYCVVVSSQRAEDTEGGEAGGKGKERGEAWKGKGKLGSCIVAFLLSV
jgi:hypothetical protein